MRGCAPVKKCTLIFYTPAAIISSIKNGRIVNHDTATSYILILNDYLFSA